jgi:hypothetical protein
MERRKFLSTLAFAASATMLPLPALPQQDDYSIFLEKVRTKMVEIIQREGRELHRIEIAPPKAAGRYYTRLVVVVLRPGPSLLDRQHFQWEEISGSRLTAWGGEPFQGG